MRIHAEAVLPGTPERAWEVLTDWERQAAWMPDVAWVRVRGSRRELGAELEVRTKVLGFAVVTDRLTVAVWEPPLRALVDHRGLVTGWGEWRLHPIPGGMTRLVWREELRLPGGSVGELPLWTYRPIQRWTMRRSLRNLARLLR
ncbi:MAG: SRPBCC family protein [Actinomycetota bacterium]